MKKIILFLAIIFNLHLVGAQEIIEESKTRNEDVSFSVIEDVPIFPGCETIEKSGKKRCFQNKMSKHISRNFNVSVSDSLGLQAGIKRIYVNFTIDKLGEVKNIKAKAPHPLLKQEGIRIIKLLPKMTPGKMRGRNVNVSYYLPISFKIE